MKKTILVQCCLIMLMTALQAQVIHVPADFMTIQQGINAANPGDTVIVSEGIYYEQINFLGKKPLVVASEFLLDGNEDHISNTIIDGSQIVNPDSSSVVYFISNEDSTSVLCGFTVQGGKGTITEYWGYYPRGGGGIFIYHSGASILNNIVQDNEANDTLSATLFRASGGGIYANNGWPDWVIIKDNTIINNRAISSHHAAEGGGIHVLNVNARIIGNLIHNNLAQLTTMEGYSTGGGFSCASDDTIPIAAVFNNEIKDNQALAPGGSFGGGGGAVNLNSSSYFKNNVFASNESSWFGGGFDVWSYNMNVWNLESNYFTDNDAVYGGALSSYDSSSSYILKNNVFIHNIASDQGGAIYVNRPNGSPEEHLLISINNSFYDNQASGAGGAIYAYEDDPLIFNSIFWQNPGLDNNEITVDNGTTEIALSDLDTNKIAGVKIIGAGMINADPLFSDTTLLLTQHWSPCVDKGAATYNCTHGMTFDAPAFDMLGTPRPVGDNYDMGAYDIQGWGLGWSSLIGSNLMLYAYPNPFSAATNIVYTVPGSCQVTVSIYNILGQLVGTPVNEWQKEGSYKVTWDSGGLEPGLFLVKVMAGNSSSEGRLIKR